ncbi:MAG: hypothetical protein ACE5FI_05840 [Anaerolineales bacterium]
MYSRAHTTPLREQPPEPLLTQRQILFFYLPLAASWLLMTLEGPSINAAIARLPHAATMIAAYGIMIGLSVTIESPVIQLLGTTTALTHDRQSYLQLRRFTIHLNLVLTVIAFLVGWTSLYDVIVRQIMDVPTAIADAAQPGMRIMLLWTAAIGWRRFKQGVLIRFGATRRVGYGTLVRLAGSAGTAVGLALFTDWPGISVGASALMVGVLSEALFAHVAARDVMRAHLSPESPASDGGELTYHDIVSYHTPLALANLMLLFAQPIIGAALSRTPDPETALAAWPVTFQLLLIVRSPGLALPEAVIALLKGPETTRAVRTFSRNLALFALIVLALIAFTPLAQLYFVTLIGVTPELGAIAINGVRVGVLIPFLMVWQGYLRGTLMARKHTRPLFTSMGIYLGTLVAVMLGVGVPLGLPGVSLAAGAIAAAMLFETLYLVRQQRLTPQRNRQPQRAFP